LPLAFVTGGTGFLGLNLVEQLARRGWEIVALHRAGSDTSRLLRFPARLAVGDIADRTAIEAAMPEAVDAVFHCAANTTTWRRHRKKQWEDNLGGTIEVVAAARRRGAKRFVHVSSVSVYDHEHGTITEATPPVRQGSIYALSKLAAEGVVKRASAEGFPAVIVNPGHIIGRYDTHNWARMIEMTVRRKVPGIPPGSGSFCHAAAVAEAMIAAAERGRAGQNYLCGGADATFVEVFHTIGRLTGAKVPKRAMPAAALQLYARILAGLSMVTGREPLVTPDAVAIVTGHARIDSGLAIRELGYQPVSLAAMLEDSYRWMKDEGLLAA
jgi:nucleoside-diphosphate-sugar epimerase